jgi:hypothetical protein
VLLDQSNKLNINIIPFWFLWFLNLIFEDCLCQSDGTGEGAGLAEEVNGLHEVADHLQLEGQVEGGRPIARLLHNLGGLWKEISQWILLVFKVMIQSLLSIVANSAYWLERLLAILDRLTNLVPFARSPITYSMYSFPDLRMLRKEWESVWESGLLESDGKIFIQKNFRFGILNINFICIYINN